METPFFGMQGIKSESVADSKGGGNWSHQLMVRVIKYINNKRYICDTKMGRQDTSVIQRWEGGGGCQKEDWKRKEGEGERRPRTIWHPLRNRGILG